MTNAKYAKLTADSNFRLVPVFSLSVGSAFIQCGPKPTAAGIWIGGWYPNRHLCSLVCRLAVVPPVSIVSEPTHADLRAGMENRWLCVPRVVRL